ncbi:hypothetical protein U9M48_042875 [Paspalum notatum var. saurae]|uniref:F-box domain-containing protein n=1 Tax=Paspalum notatum var. saurae TaxID=547442 RepID=A0AAQ3UVS0_PASNO
MSKKQRMEDPSSSSRGVGECSSASAQAPTQPLDASLGEDPLPGSEPGGGTHARVPDLRQNLVFELLMRAETRTLASAACVSREWRQLAC